VIEGEKANSARRWQANPASPRRMAAATSLTFGSSGLGALSPGNASIPDQRDLRPVRCRKRLRRWSAACSIKSSEK
jgi:hypothetical protein